MKVGKEKGEPVQPMDTTKRTKMEDDPSRRLTLLFIATAGLLAFFGTTVGAIMLASLSGVPVVLGLTLFLSHPYVQIFGFLMEFVFGVAFSLLPRFKGIRATRLWTNLGYFSYCIATTANVMFIVSAVQLIPKESWFLDVLGAALIFLSAAIFFCLTSFLALNPKGGFHEANPLIFVSGLSLLLVSALLLVNQSNSNYDVFTLQMVFLALLGFVGSMIYGVEIRAVVLRQSNYRKRWARVSGAMQFSAVLVAFASALNPSYLLFLSTLGAVLFLAAAAALVLSIRSFEFARSLMNIQAMTKPHYRIVQYNEVYIASGSIWLLLGCGLGIVAAGLGRGDPFVVWDSFIHSVAIGFIGSTVACFAPMFLPAILGGKSPSSTGLSLGPLIVLNAGLIIRVVGGLTSLFGTRMLPLWESLSGPLILAAMIWFVLMFRNLGRSRKQLPII